jgi:acyl dehydratase
LTLEEIKQKYVGKVGEPMIVEVDKSNIKMYAMAVGDLNPLFLDEEYARSSRYGGLIAPPGFFGWPAKPTAVPPLLVEFMGSILGAGYPIILDGGVDLEFFRPVRAGDVLTASPKVEDVAERTSGSGRKMAFGTIETTYINQNGEIAGKVHNTLMCLSM